jgi:hypothetical protein
VVEVADGVVHVVVDQVGVDGDGGRGAGACSGDDLGARVDDVSGGPDSGDAGASGVVDDDPAVGVGLEGFRVRDVFDLHGWEAAPGAFGRRLPGRAGSVKRPGVC